MDAAGSRRPRPAAPLHRFVGRRLRRLDGPAAGPSRRRAREPAIPAARGPGADRWRPTSRPFLLASFNGGFKWGDFTGGVLSFGIAFRGLVPGQASLIVYSDGSFTVGMWGRDNDPAKQVVGVRQNLQMLVDGGAPTPETGSLAAWGGSVAGPATMRSAVGVDANGALVWAGGRLTPATSPTRSSPPARVRAMEMDINPDWVHFNSYDVAPDGSATATVCSAQPARTATSNPTRATSSR